MLSRSIPLLPTAALLAVLITMVPLVPTEEDAKPDVIVTCGWVGGWVRVGGGEGGLRVVRELLVANQQTQFVPYFFSIVFYYHF